MSEFVQVSRDGGIAVVTIDRQEKLNALNPTVISELRDAFEALRVDDEVSGVILTGAGPKAFVAGADIGSLAEMTPLSAVETSREGQSLCRLLEDLGKPVIAAVNGYALGGGCELAMACHLRVASDTARFGLPEVTLGIMPGYGGTVRLARLVGLGAALEITLTGDMVDARRAHEIGLVNSVHPPDRLMEEAKTLLGRILRNGPVAVRMALESVYASLDASSTEAQAHESSAFGLLASTGDMIEGLTAFLEKRPAKFRGC